MRWLNNGSLNRLLPQLFARPSVEAVQVSLPARVFRTSDKDAPIRNDRAAVPRTWECHFPSDVIRRSPMERRFVLLTDTIPQRPAELRPISRTRCQRQQQDNRSSPKRYLAIHIQGETPESENPTRNCEAKRVHLSGRCVFHAPILLVRVFAPPKGYRDVSRIQFSADPKAIRSTASGFSLGVPDRLFCIR